MTAKELLQRAAEEYSAILGEKLVGIYVHGSLAFGCYNEKTSDIDFIAAVNQPLFLEEKSAIIKALLELEQYAPEKGFEMSVVLTEHCRNFVYPTPFELHYSVTYREDALSDTEGFAERMHGKDYDLAAHFTVLREVGFAVRGAEIAEVFGDVPREHYLDSITRDISGAAEDIEYNPVYYTLNLCRVLAYKRGAGVLSKLQGAEWASGNIPPVFAAIADEALDCYRTGEQFPEDMPITAFAEYMLNEING